MNLENSKINVRVAVVIIGCAISIAIAGAGAVNAIRNDIAALKKDLVPRDELIDWRDRLADDNASIKVPRIPRSKQN